MAAKLILFLAALQITYVSSTTGIFLPTFSGTGHGRLNMNWLGIKGSISLGKLLGANSSDGGILLQLRFPPQRKCMILFDGAMNAEGVGGHILVGAQYMLGNGIVAGIGGRVGMTGIAVGITVTPQIFRKNIYLELGSYAPILTRQSTEFLQTY